MIFSLPEIRILCDSHATLNSFFFVKVQTIEVAIFNFFPVLATQHA